MPKYVIKKKPIYSIHQGWLHLKCRLKNGATMSRAEMLALIGLDEDNAEVAIFKACKTVVTIVARKKPEMIDITITQNQPQ